MPGIIVGLYGQQRSGKTLLAYKMAKYIQEECERQRKEIRVYTNLYCPEDKSFVYVNSVTDLPLDLEPKIVLIDEIYNGCDAQDYRKLKDISIYINTLGKQNCLFIFTSIGAEMVYNRLRNQMNLAVLVKADSANIYYKLVFMNTLKEASYIVPKCPELFADVNYDTSFIPLDFDWSMKGWKNKLTQFYKDNYGIDATF